MPTGAVTICSVYKFPGGYLCIFKDRHSREAIQFNRFETENTFYVDRWIGQSYHFQQRLKMERMIKHCVGTQSWRLVAWIEVLTSARVVMNISGICFRSALS